MVTALLDSIYVIDAQWIAIALSCKLLCDERMSSWSLSNFMCREINCSLRSSHAQLQAQLPSQAAGAGRY